MYNDYGKRILVSAHKWQLMLGIMLKMANLMGPNKYKKSGPKKPAQPTAAEVKAFKDEFIDPSLAEVTAGIANEAERGTIKSSLQALKSPTILKHARAIMDEVVKGPEGSGPAVGKEKKKQAKGRISKAELQKTMITMEKTLAVMNGHLQDLSKKVVVLFSKVSLGMLKSKVVA